MKLNMKITVSFGVLLVVGVLSMSSVFYSAWTVDRTQAEAFTEMVPAANAALELQRETNRALAMHRGVMLLGADSLRAERSASWDRIDSIYPTLLRLTEDAPAKLREDVASLGELLDGFRREQGQIMAILGTETLGTAMKTDEASSLAAREHCATEV